MLYPAWRGWFGAQAPVTPVGVIWPIQYLRGVAAMMVVWHHAAAQSRASAAFFQSTLGTAGVDIFFVISGFVMGTSTATRHTGPVEFFTNRLVRIVPLYWALTLMMVVLALTPSHLFTTLDPTLRTTALSLLFVPHFSDTRPNETWPLLVPGWTLNFEMFFYAMFAVSLLARRHAALVLIGCCMGLSAVGLVGGPFTGAVARTYTDPVILEFAAGVLMAQLWLRRVFDVPLLVGAGLLLAGLALIVLGASDPVGSVARQCGAVLVVAACLSRVAQGHEIQSLKHLGDASYSIYLTHVLFLAALGPLWSKLASSAHSWANALSFMVLALMGSAVTGLVFHRLLEVPLTNWVRRQVGKWKA